MFKRCPYCNKKLKVRKFNLKNGFLCGKTGNKVYLTLREKIKWYLKE